MENAFDQIISPLENFRKTQIGGVKVTFFVFFLFRSAKSSVDD